MKYRSLSFLLAVALFTAVPARAQDPEAIEHYRTGYELLKNKNFRNASIELEQAVAIDSSYGAAFFALAQAYKVLDEYPKSIDAFERASKLGIYPDRIGAELAKLYHKMAINQYQQRKYQEAIDSFGKALEYDPTNAQAIYAMGLCYNGLREVTKARQSFEKAIKVDPKYAKSYKALADIHRRNREYGTAAEIYQKAIDADPKYMDAYGGLAQVKMESKDLEGTVTLMKKAIEVDPKYGHGYLFLGTALNQLGRQHEAVDPLLQAIKLLAKNPEAHYRLGEAYYGKGDYSKAVNAAQRANRLKRNFHAAELLLGDSYNKLHQVQGARDWYTRAMQDSRFRDYCKHQIEELDRAASEQ